MLIPENNESSQDKVYYPQTPCQIVRKDAFLYQLKSDKISVDEQNKIQESDVYIHYETYVICQADALYEYVICHIRFLGLETV